MKFRVYDIDGNDVTNEKDWYINPNGELFFLTNDIDSPLMEAGDKYWYGD